MTPLVFLHGWAQSQQIWFQQQTCFPDATYLNLPGHGGAEDQPAELWAETITRQLPETPCTLVGWSLGGMLSIEVANRWPERINSLALIATTPCFRAKEGWSSGSGDELFTAFKQAALSGSPKALNRFFALMLHGDALSRSDYNLLAKQAVDREHRVSEAGLAEGLKLLEELDLRSQIGSIKQPVLLIHGEQDAIVAVEAGRWLAETIPECKTDFINQCGHAPFLSQAEPFNAKLQSWQESQ